MARQNGADQMSWTDEIDMYGELGARAMEQALAEREWQAYVEGES